MTFNPLSRPDLALRNRFVPYASDVSPIDEAKAIPMLIQRIANDLPVGLCRAVVARNAAKTIGAAHDYFAEFDHPGVADRQDELRAEMTNHLYYHTLGDELYDLAEPKPQTWLQKLSLWLIDQVFPEHRTAREEAAKQLRVEQMVAKYALCTTSVFKAAFVEVAKATSDEQKAA